MHMAYLGVVNRCGSTKKARFVAFVALIKHFEAKLGQFFDIFDITIARVDQDKSVELHTTTFR